MRPAITTTAAADDAIIHQAHSSLNKRRSTEGDLYPSTRSPQIRPLAGQVTNLSVTHISGSLDRKPEEIAVRIARRPALPGDFRRARPADAHAAEACGTVFRANELVPAFFSGLRSKEAAQMRAKDRLQTFPMVRLIED